MASPVLYFYGYMPATLSGPSQVQHIEYISIYGQVAGKKNTAMKLNDTFSRIAYPYLLTMSKIHLLHTNEELDSDQSIIPA